MLDTLTLQVVAMVVDVFQALLVILVWRRETPYAGMKEFRAGMFLFALWAILVSLRRFMPLLAAILLANVFLALGSVFALNGALLLAGNRPQWRLQLPVIGIVALIFFYYLWIEPSTAARTVLLAFSASTLCLAAAASLAQGRAPFAPTTRRILAATFLLSGVAEILRGIAIPLIEPHFDFASQSLVFTYYYLELILFTLGLTVLVLHLVNERLRQDLQASEERIISAFQVASDAFALFDGAGRLIIANARFGELFPDAADRVRPGTHMSTMFAQGSALFGLDPDWIVDWPDWIVDWVVDRPAANAGRARVAQLSNGTWVHVSVQATGDGGLVLCWSDISAFKQREEMLARELASERELAAVQRGFVAMASHQFRTPLSIIDINAQLLEPRGAIPLARADATQRVGRIRRTVKRMIGLMETMMGAASAEAGKIELNRKPADLAALVREACERAQEVAPGRNFELDLDRLPPTVTCDANLIDQVLGNLISNALKYSAKTRKVMITGEHDADDAVIAVTDFGVGIAPEDQTQIFERFFRANNVRSVPGTGIGLTLARYIIDLHGGRISVVSRLGAGSTFTIRLPIAVEGLAVSAA